MEKINWDKAINIRRSTRSFEMCEVEEKTMLRLKSFVKELKVPFKNKVKVQFFKVSSGKRLYNNLKNSPPDAMAFISNTDLLSITEVGFIGEMIILYATHLGLATCWFGHYSLAELEYIMPHLGENISIPRWGYGTDKIHGERAICISPIGYWKIEGARLLDRLAYSIQSYNRKPISALLQGDISENNLSPDLLYAFDLAKKAPSAVNSQHWRFTVSSDFKTISIAMPVGYKHFKWEHPNVDIGICACHFWLGLNLKGIDSNISIIEEKGRVVWQFKL